MSMSPMVKDIRGDVMLDVVFGAQDGWILGNSESEIQRGRRLVD